MNAKIPINVQPLERAVAVLTGATSGMGFECAAQLGEAGAPASSSTAATRPGAGRPWTPCESGRRTRTFDSAPPT